MEILPQLFVNALITGSVYALASAGLSLAYGLLKILNFAHGHFMMLGAYVFFLFRVQYQQNLWLSAIATALVMAVVAFITYVVCVRPFLKHSPVLTFVSTLAWGAAIEASVSIWFGVNVQSLSRDMSFESYEWAGVYITPVQLITVLSALLGLGLLAFVIHCTSVGRKVRALAQHAPAAQGLGMRFELVTAWVFVVAVLYAAYAGIMVGLDSSLQPTMGTAFTIKAFAAMVLGGLGNVWGTVLGAYLLGLVENLSIGLEVWGYSLPAGYKDACAFVIILLVLLFRPQGLFGVKSRQV